MGDDAVARSLAWLDGMQSSNGGWGAFDVDNTSDWLYKLPFFDFGAVIDPPSEDVTAHAVEALAPHAAYADDEARPRLSAPRAAGRRLVVGPLGRQPRVRNGRGAAGARGARPRRRPSRLPPRRSLARLGSGRERWLRRGHPLLPRARVAGPRSDHGFTNGVGSISLRRGRRGKQTFHPAWSGPPLRHTARQRRLERGALHRNGFPDRLHDPLSPLPSVLPAHGPWTPTRKVEPLVLPSGAYRTPRATAKRRAGASSVAPVAFGYEHSLRPSITCFSHAGSTISTGGKHA